eukprot:984648_1
MTLLKVYLDDKLVELHLIQQQQIREIIQSPISPQKIKNNIRDANSDLEETAPFQYVYVLDVNNTLMNLMCAKTHVQKFKQIINHKLTIICVSLLIISNLLTLSLFGARSLVHTVCWRVGLCMVVPWLISQHLLCNKGALKLCLQSFDYWIKVGYSL